MPLLFDAGPRLKVEEFRLLRDLINRFCGIAFQDDALFTVERRLRDRVVALGQLKLQSGAAVTISTISPFLRRVRSGTILPLTRAPTHWWPTSVCTA